jgi:hypothetical protein
MREKWLPCRGARGLHLVTRSPGNAASSVSADTGYRSEEEQGPFAPAHADQPIHRKEPTHRPMPAPTARANPKKSAVRAHIEHVFAEQKASKTVCPL